MAMSLGSRVALPRGVVQSFEVYVNGVRQQEGADFVREGDELVFGRSLWLGEPLVIPLHRLQSGALLLFTFFMISDPRTTPNSRVGRILFAMLVAYGAWYVQFRMFRTNGLLWSLAFFSLTVPLIDRLLPGTRYEWSRPTIGRLTPNGVTHETIDSGSRSGRGLRVVGPDAQRLLRFLRSQS